LSILTCKSNKTLLPATAKFAVFAQLMSECRRACTSPLKTASSHGGSRLLSNAWFLGSTRLSIPNGISIGSAVFAQLTADSHYTLQWAPFSPKMSFSMRYLHPHPIHDYMAHSRPKPKWHLDRFSCFCTAHCRVSQCFTMGRSFPLKIAPSHVGSGPPSKTWFLPSAQVSLQSKRHFDWFSRFCRPHYCDKRQTNRQ